MDVVIERGSGFGSGSHPTTQMCLGLLLDSSPRAGRPTSAAASARSRSRPRSSAGRRSPGSTARVAIEEARANAERNGVEAALDARRLAATRCRSASCCLSTRRRRSTSGCAASTPRVRHVIVSGIVEGESRRCADYAAGPACTAQQGMAADSVDRDPVRRGVADLLDPDAAALGRRVRPARVACPTAAAADLRRAAGRVQLPRRRSCSRPACSASTSRRRRRRSASLRARSATTAALARRGVDVGRLPRPGREALRSSCAACSTSPATPLPAGCTCSRSPTATPAPCTSSPRPR